jgi:hypothetical protein
VGGSIEISLGLFNHSLAFFLGLEEDSTEVLNDGLSKLELSSNDGSAGLEHAGSLALGVLFFPRCVDKVLALANNGEWVAGNALDLFLDGGGVFLDNGELALERAQSRVTEGVGLDEIRLDIAVGRLEDGRETWIQGRVGGRVGRAHDGDGLGAVRVGLVGCDGVGDDGVAGQVLHGLVVPGKAESKLTERKTDDGFSPLMVVSDMVVPFLADFA